jgi:OmcA/MtrC family decaheme c-type cytochrome
VPGDAVRREVVKSGHDPATGEPFGCLECHETLELHGGSRVDNPQVCVMCHNPNKSSSGRTVDPANISPAVVAALGSDPLTYPEATNNFKTMIHGIHAATDRPYEFVRNRVSGFYFDWSEVTFPGDLRNCEKCHLEGTYRPESLPADALWEVERTTTGNPAETRADIIAARSSVPNLTDTLNSPTAGACYYCHDDGPTTSHILLQGGRLGITRGAALGLR